MNKKAFKVIINWLLIIFMMSCTSKAGLIMEPKSTYAVDADDTKDSIRLKAAHVVPTANQYNALKDEFIAFIHFGPNTFTQREWGNGIENPEVFNLQNLDTDQWCQAMKAAQMTKVVITVKHHDGFVLWQSRYTKHGIMSSPFKDGKGDVLKSLSESCQKYGLKLGVYLSPADLYQMESKEGLYGNLSSYSDRTIPRAVEGRPFKNKKTFTFNVDDYNEYFLNQLFELLTEYGPIHEVWFDGAHPKRKGGQKYNYLAWKELIQTLAPEAVVFGKQDVRWCGNEAGTTRPSEWNIIPYPENPSTLNLFPDLRNEDLGSLEKLYEGKFLHYQPSEVDTSIRQGWFYRNEESQKVRSTDDVFDIYERSVGGNSIFILNLPPNREGRLPLQDEKVITEVGKRVKATYHSNLFESANGPIAVLDADEKTYMLLKDNEPIEISTKNPISINRILIQEAITTHGERVQKHAVDAWIDNAWVELIQATNIGYKRILRFPEVTSNKFRIRVLDVRFTPAISNVSAHYFKSPPPLLEITRDINGMVNIAVKAHDFSWHYWQSTGEQNQASLNKFLELRYTIDGSEPTKKSLLYTVPFKMSAGNVRAKAFVKDESGSETSQKIGILKTDWKLLQVDSEIEKNEGPLAFDENRETYWASNMNKTSHSIAIDLGKNYTIKEFQYTPQKNSFNTINKKPNQGMIEEGVIKISDDGKAWKEIETFIFGNLINDPEPRLHQFKQPVNTRYVKIESRVIAGGDTFAAIAELDFYE